MKKILMLHGINHNMFGKHDPVQYCTETLADIDQALETLAPSSACTLRVWRLIECLQGYAGA